MHTAREMEFGKLRDSGRDIMREALRMHKVMLGVSDDVNRANAQTGEEVFSSWGVVPRLDRWNDSFAHQYMPLFGSLGNGYEFDYITPVPANREQDNVELLAKAQSALFLRQAGFAAAAVTKVVGLPDMEEAPPPTPAGTALSLPPGGNSEDAGEGQGEVGNLIARPAWAAARLMATYNQLQGASR
jgi:hypothetical protein